MSVGDRVGDRLALGSMLGPLRDRVAEVLADHALEGLAVIGAVKVTQQIVERPILEQDQDDMVQGALPVGWGHSRSPFIGRRLSGDGRLLVSSPRTRSRSYETQGA